MSSAFIVTEFPAVIEVRFDDGGMNLLSSSAIEELDEIVASIPPDVSLLVLRSGRENLFAAGADMQEMSSFNGTAARLFSRKGQRLMLRIARFPGRTMALVDGDCFGGALDLLLAFDDRIATPRARFSHPGSKIGIVTGFGGTTRWRRLMSPGAASHLFLDSAVLSSSEARDIGVVTEITSELPQPPYEAGGEGRAFRVAKLSASLQHLSPLQSTLLVRRLAALHEFEV